VWVGADGEPRVKLTNRVFGANRNNICPGLVDAARRPVCRPHLAVLVGSAAGDVVAAPAAGCGAASCPAVASMPTGPRAITGGPIYDRGRGLRRHGVRSGRGAGPAGLTRPRRR
jgi:hypothetical protein